MKSTKRIWSQLELEQFIINELEASLTTELRLDIESDSVLKQELDNLIISNNEILQQYQTSIVVQKIKHKQSQNETTTSLLFGWKLDWSPYNIPAVALSACIVLAVATSIIAPISQIEFPQAVDDGIRIKGILPHIVIFRDSAGNIEKLNKADIVKNNDVIQIAYHAARRHYGAIFSIDGLNIVTLHFPSQQSDDASLKQDGLIALDKAYRLDDSPGKEVFYFFTSDNKIDIKTLQIDLQRYQTLSISQLHNLAEFKRYRISTLSLYKDKK